MLSGFIDIATAPCLAHSAFVSGELAAFVISAFSLSTISFGVPFGAMMPSQMVAS